MKNIKRNLGNSHTIKVNYNSKFKPYKAQIIKPVQLKRKKIMHLVANFWTGGSSRLVVDLVEHLGHLYNQKVITRDVPDIPAYSGFPMIVDESEESSKFIYEELRRFRSDIVHVHYLGHHQDKWGEQDWQWYDQAFNALEKYGCPIVENINIPTEPYSSDQVQRYAYVSKFVKDKYARSNHHNTVVYPGSDFTRFERKNLSDIPNNCIGMVYRLERDKINEDSIKVFIEVIKRREGTKALIVGGGSLLGHFRKSVDEAGLNHQFTFTKYVAYDDLPEYYKKMSVFIAPVHNESFGQVTPMAMNMGIPVVAYRVGALPEIISNEQLLATPGDYKELAKIVVAILDDREYRLKIGAANHVRAQKLFSVEAMIQSYKSIYNEILTKN